MSRFSLAKTSPKVLCLTAALVLGTGAFLCLRSVATSSTGEINGCYNNNNGGQLRVLPAAATCDSKKETAVSWNNQGIQGVAGAQGIPGDRRPAGDQGLTGRRVTPVPPAKRVPRANGAHRRHGGDRCYRGHR